MKKILFLIPTLCAGGAEKVLINLVNHMDFSRFDVTVQTIVDIGEFRADLRPEVHYKTIAKSNAAAYLVQFVLPPRLVYDLYIKDRKNPYDVEVAFLEGSSAKILAHSTNKKAKKIVWIHLDLFTLDENETVFSTTEKARACYEKFDKIVCVSRDVQTGFIKKFGLEEKTAVYYNAIDDVMIRAKAQESIELPPLSGIRFVSSGRHVHFKGFDRLLRVLARLKDDYSFSLILLGSGPQTEMLQELAESLGLSDRVFFTGFQQNPYPYVASADAYVCSSFVEGFATVVIEALVLDLPVVTTDCSGMRDMLESNAYGLITENSEDGLYEGLRKFLNNRALRDQYKLQASVRANVFKLEKCVMAVQELLDTI